MTQLALYCQVLPGIYPWYPFTNVNGYTTIRLRKKLDDLCINNFNTIADHWLRPTMVLCISNLDFVLSWDLSLVDWMELHTILYWGHLLAYDPTKSQLYIFQSG